MLAAEAGSSGSSLVIFLPLLLMMAGLWFLMNRQNRNRKQQAQRVAESLAPGVEIMTTAGLLGRVVDVDDTAVTIEVAPGVTNRYVRAAIAKVVEPPVPAQPEPTDARATDD